MSNQNFMEVVKSSRPNTNVFDLTHNVKLTANMGNLVPILAMEAVPGDKIRIGVDSIFRFAPMRTPTMHRFDCSIHYFKVPMRLLWDNWEKYITQTPVAGSVPAHPYLNWNTGNTATYPLADYMGLPSGAATLRINPFFFSAYQFIVNEYYRDQNLQTEVDYKLVDGDNDANVLNLVTMRKRCWEKDYFTSALPNPQKGTAAQLPIGVIGNDVPVYVNNGGTDISLQGIPANMTIRGQASSTPQPSDEPYAATTGLAINPTTINDLRIMMRMQEWLEKMMRGGSRFSEYLRNIWGVTPEDARLQRPEYITGVKTPVVISEVLNTGGDAGTIPQGNMAGHGTAIVSGDQGSTFITEHSVIIGIMSILPKTAYQQGVPKFFLKTTDAFDYFTPQFANIGEQPIENRELYVDHTQPTATFGYTPRYAEYKTLHDRVHGQFKTTLDFWHAGRIFTSQPNLNSAFVSADPTHRIFAVTNPADDKVFIQLLNKVTAIRPMPKFGTPTF